MSSLALSLSLMLRVITPVSPSPAVPASAGTTSSIDEAVPLRRWGVDASTGAAYVTDRAFDLVGGSDALPVGDFRVSFTPGWVSGHLELNGAYVIAGEGGSSLSSWQTSFNMQSIQLGALYRWRPLGFLSLYARGAALLDLDRLTLTSTNDALPLAQTALTAGALLGGGVELAILRERHFDAGITLEMSYAERFNKANFAQLTPDSGSTTPAPIASAPVNAGAFDVSGIQWRLGLAFHF